MFPKSKTMENFTINYEQKILKLFQEKFPDGQKV